MNSRLFQRDHGDFDQIFVPQARAQLVEAACRKLEGEHLREMVVGAEGRQPVREA